jgi:hypothetical protein
MECARCVVHITLSSSNNDEYEYLLWFDSSIYHTAVYPSKIFITQSRKNDTRL